MYTSFRFRFTISSNSKDQKLQLSGEEQERKIGTYEEAMSKIKDATGVSDIQVHLIVFLTAPFELLVLS